MRVLFTRLVAASLLSCLPGVAHAGAVSLLNDYVGESQPKNKVWLRLKGSCAHVGAVQYDAAKNPDFATAERCQVKYLNPQERLAFRLTYDEKAKVWRDFTGQVFDTNQAFKALRSSGVKPVRTAYDLIGKNNFGSWPAIWVLDTANNLYVSVNQGPGQFHHSSFTAGGDIQAGGQIVITNGVITAINNASGHYQPSDAALFAAIANIKHVDPGAIWCYHQDLSSGKPKDTMKTCAHVQEPVTVDEINKYLVKEDTEEHVDYKPLNISMETIEPTKQSNDYIPTSEQKKYIVVEEVSEYISIDYTTIN